MLSVELQLHLQKMVAPTKYIMRLKSGIQFQSVKNICAELAGGLPNMQQRFKGACDGNFASVSVS